MLTVFTQYAIPCSSFRITNTQNSVFAKSYDWDMGQGHILVNKRNVEKTTLRSDLENKSSTWVSKYGSLSFNQYGREFPLGGVNEAGLSIEILWLNESEYPTPNSKKSFNELQWIQYLLDTQKNVKDMISMARSIRISPVYANVHYIACDTTKTCAVLEYIKGKLIVHANLENEEPLKYPSITNDTYQDSLDYLSKYEGFGGKKALPTSSSSLDRFVRATALAQEKNITANSAVKYGFKILDSVASGSYSKWNIVYDLNMKSVSYRTRFGTTGIKTLSLDQLDFSCKTPVQYIDIEDSHSGEVINFMTEQTYAINKALVTQSLKGFPTLFKWMVQNYPQTTKCLSN